MRTRIRFSIVLALAGAEVVAASAIFACSLELSQCIARSNALGTIAHIVVRSTRRLAASSIRVRITLGDA